MAASGHADACSLHNASHFESAKRHECRATRIIRRLDRPQRRKRRPAHPRADPPPASHAGLRGCVRTAGRPAAAVALAVLPARRAPVEYRRRWSSAARRFPAAGCAAAPHVGRRTAAVPAPADRRCTRAAPIDDHERAASQAAAASSFRDRTARNQRRTRRSDPRRTGHRTATHHRPRRPAHRHRLHCPRRPTSNIRASSSPTRCC